MKYFQVGFRIVSFKYGAAFGVNMYCWIQMPAFQRKTLDVPFVELQYAIDITSFCGKENYQRRIESTKGADEGCLPETAVRPYFAGICLCSYPL